MDLENIGAMSPAELGALILSVQNDPDRISDEKLLQIIAEDTEEMERLFVSNTLEK